MSKAAYNKTKSVKPIKLIKSLNIFNFIEKTFLFKSKLKLKRLVKKRRSQETFRPTKKLKKEITFSNLQNFSQKAHYLKYYVTKNPFKKRFLLKKPKAFRQIIKAPKIKKNREYNLSIQKLHYKNTFLNSYHFHCFFQKKAKVKKIKKNSYMFISPRKRKRYWQRIMQLKYNNKKHFIRFRIKKRSKKFIRITHLKKMYSLEKSIFRFFKKKTILLNQTFSKKSWIQNLNFIQHKRKKHLSLKFKQIFHRNAHTKTNLKVQKTTYLKLRLPSWKILYLLQKKNKNFYNSLWVNFSKKKRASFTRTLALYQNATYISSNFKKNALHEQNIKSINSIQNTHLLSSLFMNYVVKNTHLNTFHTYLTEMKFTKKLTFLDITYKTQFVNILNARLKNYRTFDNHNNSIISHFNYQLFPKSHHKIQQRITKNIIVPNLVQFSKPKINTKVFLLLNLFLLENYFTFSPKTSSNRTVCVLSRVPNYKMNLSSSVSADRYRGNIHKRLSITNLNRLSNQKVPALLTKLNLFSSIDFLKKNSKLNNIEFLKIKKFLQESNNTKSFTDVIYYIKSKVYFVFIKNALKVKYHKQVKEILRQNKLMKKTVKNKKKIKKYAIERTKKITALKPKMKFYKIFLFKSFLTKKLAQRRLNARLKRRQSIRFNLRFPLFRKNYSQKKNSKYKKTRFIKNLLYFSHTKLNNMSEILKKFNELNVSRKRYLAKVTSPRSNSVAVNTWHNNFFITQKNKNQLNLMVKPTHHNSPNINIQNILSISTKYKTIYNNSQLLLTSLLNTILLKTTICNQSSNLNVFNIKTIQFALNDSIVNPNLRLNNLIPDISLNKVISKNVINSFKNNFFQENVISWYHNTMIRFIEDCTGKKTLFQFYPFMSQDVNLDFIVRYKRWLPRMVFYERKLGHRFFLEEAIHIIHLSFYLKDPKIICSWLKAMILRISFWKTRSIFRFLKYLFFNYFQYVFNDIGIKGLKIRLKGKISAAGNSRKRTILYRIGNTSHSTTSLRVLNESTTINTFTGVMGFNVWLFY